MGIVKRGRHCLKAINSYLSGLNIKFLIKYLRSVAGKLIEIKKPPENLFISPQETKHQPNICFSRKELLKVASYHSNKVCC